MAPSKLPLKRFCLLIAAAALVGCTASSPDSPSGNKAEHKASANHIDKAQLPTYQTIQYYIGKLPDRDYVDTYGGDENPRPWYIAAGALGQIGKAAVPALVKRLDTQDPYELKLALYALMLASQDPDLQAKTGGDYLRLDTVLTQDTNKENRQRALDWWQRYRHLWQ